LPFLASDFDYPIHNADKVKINDIPIFRPSGGRAGTIDVVYYHNREPVLLIEAKAKTIPAIFEAIRQKKFRNITSPLKIPSRVFIKFFWGELNDQLAKIFRTEKLKPSTALSKKGLASLIPEEFPSLDQ